MFPARIISQSCFTIRSLCTPTEYVQAHLSSPCRVYVLALMPVSLSAQVPAGRAAARAVGDAGRRRCALPRAAGQRGPGRPSGCHGMVRHVQGLGFKGPGHKPIGEGPPECCRGTLRQCFRSRPSRRGECHVDVGLGIGVGAPMTG